MLQTEQLAFAYPGQKKIHFADLTCRSGEQWLILGQSGSGKTTLLHLLGGLRTATEGKVIIDNTNLTKLSQSQLDHFRGQQIGIVFQQAHFVRSLNVMENLVLAQQLAGVKPSLQHIKDILARLNLQHKFTARTENLSQGEQQRVAIARALVNKPSLILADEPTSALDDINCEEVVNLLTEQAASEQATLLVVTHDGRLKDRFERKILLPQS